MTDLDDVVQTLTRLREVIDVRSPLLTRTVTGIEVTQAVQYYHSASHLTDPADRAADNAATLVAYKPAVVRAYVQPAPGRLVGDPVGGTLHIERRQGFGPWKDVATLSPWLASTVTPAFDDYADERGNIGQSLNFRIPASQFAGYLRLTVELDTGETRTTTVSAYLVQTLRVRIIPVHYQGPSTSSPAPGTTPATLNLAAPTLADAQTTAALAFRMMPVQQTGSFASAGTLDWSSPLDDVRSSPGACSTNWNSLLTSLRAMRDNDGNRADVVYYGLLPTGIPLNVPGCGEGGLGSATVGDTVNFVHEIGHGYGFAHTPSGNAGTTDPNYPVYEPYPSASIGEYGLDIQSAAVFSPATSTDYMSYGPARWMSLYQHKRLINHDRLAPTSIKEKGPFDDTPVAFDPKHLWWPNPPWRAEQIETYTLYPLISVRGVIDETGTVRVDSVARITANPVMLGPEISWSAQLIGESEDVAARARLTRVVSFGGEGCGCTHGSRENDPDRLPLEFHAMIPDAEPGTALRILDGSGEEVWARTAPDTPPQFGFTEGWLSDESTLRLTWALEMGKAADVWAQYSTDGGEAWRGLTVGLRDGSAEVDATALPAGEVLVRLLAHDGFSTATSEPMRVDVPERAPYPAILYPADGETVPAGVEVEVLGSAVDQGGEPIGDDLLEWVVDGESFARGRTATLRVEPGDHELTLRVFARIGAEATVRFAARPLGG